MLSVLFAVLTALSNGAAAVLQRRAASEAPASSTMRLSLLTGLLRRPVWLAGIGLVIVAAGCQAVALATGPISVVQPIFVIELPMTLVLGGIVFHRTLPRRAWYAVAAVTAGLALALGSAAPAGGTEQVEGWAWAPALSATAVFELLLVLAGLRTRGNPRAALFGLAAACAYALTAALMKDAMARVGDGAAAFFSAWQLYGMAVAGVGALFLLQNALQAGSLAASQPMLTLGDALISTAYGVTLFGEHIRTGPLLVPELAGVALVAAGIVVLARTLPEAQGGTDFGPPPRR